MTPTRIPATLRQQVRQRAGLRCEYCLLAEADAFFPHEPDHIIAIKHGGETTEENLALSCFDCNRFKGSDVSSIDPVTGQLTPLFNPRSHLVKPAPLAEFPDIGTADSTAPGLRLSLSHRHGLATE